MGMLSNAAPMDRSDAPTQLGGLTLARPLSVLWCPTPPLRRRVRPDPRGTSPLNPASVPFARVVAACIRCTAVRPGPVERAPSRGGGRPTGHHVAERLRGSRGGSQRRAAAHPLPHLGAGAARDCGSGGAPPQAHGQTQHRHGGHHQPVRHLSCLPGWQPVRCEAVRQ
jgi:hypothetical protein